MEFPEEDVIDVISSEVDIKIIYGGGGNETITKDKDGTQMRDLSFASRGNPEGIQNLNNFFVDANKTEDIKFFNYMRKRDLTFEKQKWIKIKSEV